MYMESVGAASSAYDKRLARREGTKRKFSWEDDGTFHDRAMYGLLRDEYIMEPSSK